MRTRLLVLTLVVFSASVTYSLIQGQERKTPPSPVPVVETPAKPSAPATPTREPARLSKLQQQMLLTAQRGADWLYRMHGVKGRFLPGINVALKQTMPGATYQQQAAAAAALGRAARICGEERFSVRATQALLALLEDTAPDPSDSLSRYTTLPPIVVNRLSSAGELVLAIHELPAPQKDLLDRAEELVRYLSRQSNPEGPLRDHLVKNAEASNNPHPGVALAALARNHRVRPAPWKLDVVRRAMPTYRTAWRKNRSLEVVPKQTTAYVEAYLACKDKALADFVFEMNDWVCSLQYVQIDPRRMNWFGGFMSWKSGQRIESEPTADCAALAEGLAQARRLAGAVGDVERHQRYTDALERNLQYLVTLQYTEARTQHFASWYREQLVGGFHASHQDGNLHLEHVQLAVSAMLGYLDSATR